ncbi:MAG: flagellar biosynthesis protein FlhA [Bacillota bacterium]
MPSPVAPLSRVKAYTDLIIAGLVIGAVLLIIIPLPPAALDVCLVLSLTAGILTLLITLFTTDPLQFSVFPTWLLIVTLYRLALNISSTRLILGQAAAGRVIDAFGHFVVGGSYVVGFIVFVIITIVQFIVITNGANRVAEVAARFTLDAMPGKQMSIDGDFNAGLITEAEARERRKRLQREADFFGAMDGATKFIRGDAIAGLVITLVNILGGLVMGLVVHRMDLLQSLQTYTILTIGDGLVTQIPAVLVATGTGVLVTRASPEASFGREFSRQFFSFPRVMFVAAGILFVIGLVPAMPNFLFMALAVAVGLAARTLVREERRRAEEEAAATTRRARAERREPENVLTYFQVDPLEVEIGYNLIPLADEEAGGDLLHRVGALRRQCAQELGIFVRPIRIRDNLQLPPNGYVFKLRGVEAARGELMPGHYLALDPTGSSQLKGVPTKEPTFGLPAYWITPGEKERAEGAGFTVVDAGTVLITHLGEFVKQNAPALLGRQEVKELLDTVKEKNAAVVEELIPNLLSLGEVQKVLQNLLKERVPVRDLVGILEALADAARTSRDTDYLTEQARQALARVITRLYAPEGKLQVITLHPKLEQALAESLSSTALGTYPVLEPGAARRVVDRLRAALDAAGRRGANPVVLCAGRVRLPFRRLIERNFPLLPVVALQEITPDTEVEAIGTVMWDED